MAPQQVSFETGQLVILHQHAEGAPGAGEGRHLDSLLFYLVAARVTSMKSQSQIKLTAKILHYILVPAIQHFPL